MKGFLDIKKKIRTAIILLLAVISLQCRKDIKGVSVEVSFSDWPLSDRLITDVQYRWKTSRSFVPLKEDCAIFVHFWHRSNLILHDGHHPPLPVSQWKPRKEYAYSRRIYIPRFIDESDPEFKGEEILRLSVGLAMPAGSRGKPMRKVLEKALKVFPPPADSPKIDYGDGWYDLEVNPETSLKRWRWTDQEAECLIDNPRRDALLVIKGGVNKEAVKDQRVIFKINNRLLDEFIPEGSSFEKSYKMNKEALGGENKFVLSILTDKTFVPAQVFPGSKDKRRLGIQVSFLYFR